jgi:enterochelin esterase-like enzyme
MPSKSSKNATGYQFISSILNSTFLKREVRIDFYFPGQYTKNCHVLFLNDGQDAKEIELLQTIASLTSSKKIAPLIVVAIHANENRLQEYGVASKADFAKRGRLARPFSRFITEEAKSFTESLMQIKIQPAKCAIAGFSLGGLSAFDIAWHHAHIFGMTGVFSGSFWWRKKDYKKGYTDKDRIMHEVVRKTKTKPHLKFWIQTGTKDETADRNQNGIIDSIEDSVDLIKELKEKGFTEKDIEYLEVQGGMHNQKTWSKVLPHFLIWAFGSRKSSEIY